MKLQEIAKACVYCTSEATKGYMVPPDRKGASAQFAAVCDRHHLLLTIKFGDQEK